MLIQLPTLRHILRSYNHRALMAIFVWSIACGIPLLMVLSTLAARLLEAGISLPVIGLFSTVTIPYSLKFLVAPLVERTGIPLLSRYFGRARSWMLASMLGVMLGLILMGIANPYTEHGLEFLYWSAFFVVVCSSINDIAEAEVRIELIYHDKLGPGTACYTTGYRIGMVAGSSLALIIASFYSWELAYIVLAMGMWLGILAVICQPAAQRTPWEAQEQLASQQFIQQFSIRSTWIKKLFIDGYRIILAPIRQFMQRPGWLVAIGIIIFYNYSDSIMIMMANPFYLTIGISKTTIGTWQGGFGVIMIILGGFLCHRFGAVKLLFFSAILHMFITLLIYLLAHISNNGANSLLNDYYFISGVTWFKLIIIIGSFNDGLSATGYMTLISARCQAPYTATQNALLTSMMAATKILFASSSGFLVELLTWQYFFLFSTIAMLPSMILIIYLGIINKRHHLTNH